MTENKFFNIKKYALMSCLTMAVAFAPVCPANARSHHHGDTLVAAAVGGAVAGLVGAVVQNTLNQNQTIIQPTYVEPAPVVVRETVVVREPYYHRPTHHSRRIRHHYRHH